MLIAVKVFVAEGNDILANALPNVILEQSAAKSKACPELS